MKRTLFLAFLIAASCNQPTQKNNTGFNNSNNNTHEVCDNTIDDDGDGRIDCEDLDCLGVYPCGAQNNANNTNNQPQPLFTVRGTVWGPGADNASVLEANRFPVPYALVAAFPYEPPDPEPLPQGLCTPCVDVPAGIIHQFTESDGSFELKLYPNTDYWLVVQKGQFRRVSQIRAGEPNGEMDLNVPAGQARNSITTLPNRFNPNLKQWIPKILVVEGSYEDMTALFSSLGFDYGVEIQVLSDTDSETESIFRDLNRLRQYNLIITTCGDDASFLTNSTVRQNLRQYIQEGGKLYVDDFSYDFAEQPFPEFLSYETSSGTCGSGAAQPSTVGECNHWSSYNPAGEPGDPYFADWLNVVNPGGNISLEAAWDIIATLTPGLQGNCENDADPNCQNGQYVAPPKVWMYGNWSGYTHRPVTVSWNYFCGKVLYTVYHTHSSYGSGSGFDYELLLQEKIMMYLIMEIQTCTDPVIIG